MNKSNLTLLKMLLASTSRWNIYRHCKDKKKRGKIVGNTIGFGLLYLILVAYCVATSIGYGSLGLTDMIPSLCALTISVAGFLLTLLKTNGYLFNFKEYDMLMSLPFTSKAVAACKFFYMYIKSLPLTVIIAFSMLVGYGYYAAPKLYVYPVWMIMALILPIIPMLIAAFLGFLIARIGAEFKRKNVVQTVLTFAFTLLALALRFIIEDLIKSGEMEDVMTQASDGIRGVVSVYLPAFWFTEAVEQGSLVSMFTLPAVTVLIFTLVFIPVGNSYRMINSKLKSHASAKKFRMTKQKKYGVLSAIAFKELKRMTGSTTYMVNAGMGELLALILGGAALFVDFDKLLETVTNGAPITTEMVFPAIPLIVYFMIGMIATTAMSPSLEGKNRWIVQSLPISDFMLYQGKMLFNMYLTVPFMVIATVSLGLSAHMPVLTLLLSLVLGFVLCAFSTAWGCVCGIKFARFDWENEVEVVKQGTALTAYMFPNMFATMILIVGVVALGTVLNRNIVLLIMILIVSILAGLSYGKVVKISKKQGH